VPDDLRDAGIVFSIKRHASLRMRKMSSNGTGASRVLRGLPLTLLFLVLTKIGSLNS